MKLKEIVSVVNNSKNKQSGLYLKKRKMKEFNIELNDILGINLKGKWQ